MEQKETMSLNLPLFALAAGAFGIGTTEFAPMGLLPVIAAISTSRSRPQAYSSPAMPWAWWSVRLC